MDRLAARLAEDSEEHSGLAVVVKKSGPRIPRESQGALRSAITFARYMSGLPFTLAIHP